MSLKDKTILIVDDDDLTLKMLRMIFQSAGARVLIESDCEAASMALDHIRPDVIILDINEVDMGDSLYCKQIKEKFSQLATPLIITSTITFPQYKDKLSYLSDIKYFQKPYSSLHLLKTVSESLKVPVPSNKAKPFSLQAE